MTTNLIILCAAAVALVAFATSAVTAFGLRLARKRIASLAPAGQARVYFAATIAPLFIAAIALGAVFAPSFGLIADHCGLTPTGHAHPHVCANHPYATPPALGLIALGVFLLARFALALVAQLSAVVRAQLTLQLLDRQSKTDTSGTRILPIDGEAQAFVLGLFRPTLFVTESLMSGPKRPHLDAVLAHEQAHIRRGDPLRRFAAKFGLAFHLPFFSRRLDSALGRSVELAADSEAADIVGADRVASALIALSRRPSRVPKAAFAFSKSNIEARVVSLLATEKRPNRPRRTTVVALAAIAIIIVAISADPIHHGLETLLGAFGA